RRARRVERERLPPRAVALDPLVRPAHGDRFERRVRASVDGPEQLRRPQGTGVGGQLAVEPGAVHRAGQDCAPDVLIGRPALALASDDDRVGGQRPTEAALGPGGEALAVAERELHPPEAPLPHVGQVAMARPPDLAQLGEAEAHPHRPAPWPPAPAMAGSVRPTRVAPSVTGTVPPLLRSWPVPWLPPAGGTGDATTCSMP